VAIIIAWISIAVCLIALVMTIALQRRMRFTLALPLGYMINLLLIHLPGAYAFAISGGRFVGLSRFEDSISTGIALTAVGAISFVAGLAIGSAGHRLMPWEKPDPARFKDPRFSAFCLISGWVLAFGVGALRDIPTLGAAIYYGSVVWMLVAASNLAQAVRQSSAPQFAIWSGVVLSYPALVLLLSGFMSYGAIAVIIVGSLTVSHTKTLMRSLLLIVALGFLGISVFVNYFGARSELRSTLWSGARLEQRVSAVSSAFSDFELFSPGNPDHLRALSMRLNQNEFVGLAADRLANGQVEYRKGASLYESLVAVVPRIVWKDKPATGGGGTLVRELTGLNLSGKSAWGVGNVLEFYSAFGLWSMIPCFIGLGWLLGWLDRKSASLLGSADPSRSFLYFLPAVTLIQPIGSIVEIVGGVFAALLAAVALRMAWKLVQEIGQAPAGQTANALPRGLQ